MSAAIKDIVIRVIDGVITATGVNFSVPLVIGFTGSRYVISAGSGISSLVARSVERGVFFSLEIVIDEGASDFAYALGSENDLVITCPPNKRIRDLIADFNTNAPDPVTDLVELISPDTGAGVIGALASTDATQINYQRVEDIAQIVYFYDGTDPEYKMVLNMLAASPTPGVVYLLNAFEKTGDDLTNLIRLYDFGHWFCALTTALDEARQMTISDYINSVDRIALFTSNLVARLDVVKGDHVAYVIHNKPEDHPEVSWAAHNLPDVPQVGWKWTPFLYGQTANTEATLTDLLNVREKKGNSYVTNNGVDYMDGSHLNSASGLHIDQIISRLWIKINLELDLQNLFTQTAARNERIPYTDGGIGKITGVIAKRLNIAGSLSVIAPVETPAQASKSFDGQYRFSITAATRTEIEAARPADITARKLKGIRYAYIEAGAIEEVEITGVILLTEG